MPFDHMALKYIGYTLGAGYLMRQNSGRTLACGSSHFAHPDTDSFTHVARRELKPLISPISSTSGIVEARLTIQAIEIGADELAILHGNAVIVDKIRHTA